MDRARILSLAEEEAELGAHLVEFARVACDHEIRA